MARSTAMIVLVGAIALIALIALNITGCGGKQQEGEGTMGPEQMGPQMGPGQMGPGQMGPGGGMMPGGAMGGMSPSAGMGGAGAPGGGGAPSAPAGSAAPEAQEQEAAPDAPQITPAAPPTEHERELVNEAIRINRDVSAGRLPAPPKTAADKNKASNAEERSSQPARPTGPQAAAPADSERFQFLQASGPPGKQGPAGPMGPGADMQGQTPAPTGDDDQQAPQASRVPAAALATEIYNICQDTRGLQMTKQKWLHEYWYFATRKMLYGVLEDHKDFPLVQLVHAAQVKNDWEGYFWHWAMRNMLDQNSPSDLEALGESIADARLGLATIRAISQFGMLMHDVDKTRLGAVLAPTTQHVLNCIEFAFGNPNFDPASIERDESQRSRLMVEVFDNYLMLGHNWRWERSRNWAYLARVSNNLPDYRCDSCGKKLTRDHQMWRCPRCGKAARPHVPGTLEAVEPNKCLDCGYQDQYRTYGLQCPACLTSPDGRYVLRRSWNSPTFARIRQGLRNAQHTHHLAELVFAEGELLPTRADRQAYQAWLATSPCPERVPDMHRMELEAHEVRLRDETVRSHK